MDEMLDSFIETHIPHGWRQAIRDAIGIFSQTEGNQIVTILINMISSEHEDEPVNMVGAFYETICSFMTSLIKEMGVFPTNDAPLDFLVKVYNALDEIPDYMDKESIIQVCYLEEADAVDRLHELLNLNSYFRECELHEHIESVNVDMFKKLISVVKNGIGGLVITEVPVETKFGVMVQTLKDLSTFFEFKEYIGFKIIEAGGFIGATFKDYAEPHINELVEKPLDVLTQEIMILLAMSSDGFVDPIGTFRKYASFMFDGKIQQNMEVDNRLIAHQGKFNLYVQNKALT